MRALSTTTAPGEPLPARDPAPRDVPRRPERAALAVAGVLAHLLLAPLALLLATALHLAGRLARWRPAWLAAPAAAGLLWVLALGPRAALAGFTDGPRHVLTYLAAAPAHPERLAHPGRAFAGLGRWLPRQAPVALLVASAETALAGWVRGAAAGRSGGPGPRPGLLAAARRQWTARAVKYGGVAGRAGGVLGADRSTGRPVEVGWQAAAGGVLVSGDGPVAAVAFQLVHAAVRRRKPVVVVDLAGTPGLAGRLAAVCAAVAAPLQEFAASGPACYDPLRDGAPARNAALVIGMIDWPEQAGSARSLAASYLNDLFAVAAAAPGDPWLPVLDEVVALLRPAALRARVSQVPPYHPCRGSLAERAAASASRLEADPGTAAFLASELAGLRGSPLGRWLRCGDAAGAGVAAPGISLDAVVRDRAVALFSLDARRHGRPARLVANLVAGDLQARYADDFRQGVPGDGLAVVTDCGLPARPALAALVATGARAGLATVFCAGPGSAAAPGDGPALWPGARPGVWPGAGQLASLVNVQVQANADGALSVRGREPAVDVPAAWFVPGSRP